MRVEKFARLAQQMIFATAQHALAIEPFGEPLLRFLQRNFEMLRHAMQIAFQHFDARIDRATKRETVHAIVGGLGFFLFRHFENRP